MTDALRRYELATARMRIARAQLLAQLAAGRGADRLPDLLAFAEHLGAPAAADTLDAFRAAQTDAEQAAQAEVASLTGRRALRALSPENFRNAGGS